MTIISLTPVHGALETLALAEMDAVVETHLERAANESRPYADVLVDLLEREVEARRTCYLCTRMRLAHLAYAKDARSV